MLTKEASSMPIPAGDDGGRNGVVFLPLLFDREELELLDEEM